MGQHPKNKDENKGCPEERWQGRMPGERRAGQDAQRKDGRTDGAAETKENVGL